MSFTLKEFIIDNIKSSDIGISGVSIVRTDSEIQTPWIGGKDLKEDQVAFKDVPYFYRTQKQPLEFSLKFSLISDEYTSDVLLELGRIFGQDKYVEFQTTDFMGKIFYVIPTSPIKIITFGNYQGWFEVSLRANAPYAWTLPEITTFDLSSITVATTIELDNISNVQDSKTRDFYYYPELWIDLKSTNTGITLLNQSDGGRVFQFSTLDVAESLYVNNNLKQIVSSTGLYRLSKFNKNWFRLTNGKNQIQVTGKSIIQFKCQFPVYV